MPMNILTLWICCTFFIITEQKFKAINFRTLPLTKDKLTIAESPSYNLFEPYGPGTYAFGYEVEDNASKNIQFRDEEKLKNGTVQGSYGLVRPNGLVSITRYVADDTGYHSTTQTFNQNDKKPNLLTSTLSPFLEISSPSDVMFLDVPNPGTISPELAQQILEPYKNDLMTPSSNIPITDIFSSDDTNTLSDRIDNLSSSIISQIPPEINFDKNEINKFKLPETNLNSVSGDRPSIIQNPSLSAISNVPSVQSTTESEKGSISSTVNSLADVGNEEKSSSTELPSTGLPQFTNIFQNILPHIPQIPLPPEMATSTRMPSASSSSSLSDVTQNESSSISTPTTAKPSNNFPQFTNIFENIFQTPQLPFPSNMVTSTKKPSTSSSNPLSDITSNESTSTSSPITSKPSNNFPQFPNIFENLLPHIPQIPLPTNIMSTTTQPSSTDSNLADENENVTIASNNQSTINKPASENNALPQLPSIFDLFNPTNFPIFKPPSNLLPNKQENPNTTDTNSNSSPMMDTSYEQTTPIEPVFAIIHKNATIVPIYDDDGTTITGIQLINNFIPSNFHIIPFIIPSNYFQQSTNNPAQQQNIAHDEVNFDDKIPNFVNDKFHDPLDDDFDLTWKSRSRARKRNSIKKSKVRRNSNQRLRCKT